MQEDLEGTVRLFYVCASFCYNLPLDWRVTNQAKKTSISERYAQIDQTPISIVRDMTASSILGC